MDECQRLRAKRWPIVNVLQVAFSPVLLLSKSRKHFVTVGYADDEGHQQALVFRLDKGDIRMVLAAIFLPAFSASMHLPASSRRCRARGPRA